MASSPRSNTVLLPQTAEYALRAMAWIAVQAPGEPIQSKALSECTAIPSHYLSKVLRKLVVAGLLHSQKGHHGGFSLALPPDEVTFARIIDAVGELPSRDRCAFGWGGCDAANPCLLHDLWSTIQDDFLEWAEQSTLADLDKLDPDTLRTRLGAGACVRAPEPGES